jgi:S1/P1 Nuclease
MNHSTSVQTLEPNMPCTNSRRLPAHPWFIVALAVLVVLRAAPPVWAWGPLGHRIIARLAERHMTPEAKAGVAALLESGESIADASLWADENVGRLPRTAPWHYVDVPLDEPRYDARFSGNVASKGCVVEKINEFRQVVKDKSKSIEERRLALWFLLHCIGDLHQPCHVGDNHDKGGNLTQVQWFDRGSNMHRVWDSGIIERAGDTEDFWLADLAELDTAENRAAWMAGKVEDWATESLLAARAAYQVHGSDKRIKSGQKLGEGYQAAHLPVVRRRLCQAGLRLAWVLNEAFPAE